VKLKRNKRPDPPDPDGLEFGSDGMRVMYEHFIKLYDRVGSLEGKQAVILALVLAAAGAAISTAVKVWGG